MRFDVFDKREEDGGINAGLARFPISTADCAQHPMSEVTSTPSWQTWGRKCQHRSYVSGCYRAAVLPWTVSACREEHKHRGFSVSSEGCSTKHAAHLIHIKTPHTAPHVSYLLPRPRENVCCCYSCCCCCCHRWCGCCSCWRRPTRPLVQGENLPPQRHAGQVLHRVG